MSVQLSIETGKTAVRRRRGRSFTEADTWRKVGGGWRQLHGSFRDLGYSIEWHDFETERELDWSGSFHPEGVEICLNLTGRGEVRAGNHALAFAPSISGFYAQNGSRLSAMRRGGERHQFITIELSLRFLERHLAPHGKGLDSRLDRMLASNAPAAISEPGRLTSEHQQLAMRLRNPPVSAAAQPLWYQAKVLEMAAALLYRASPDEELFCQRCKRLSQERVLKVVAILKENVAEPPSLEELGRRVGCSHFYLSRIFTQEMGRTISAHLRDLRMERAAELLREGRFNVTEAALAVGYSSLSHFSAAFHETFGCCPGLYPLATSSQRAVKRSRF